MFIVLIITIVIIGLLGLTQFYFFNYNQIFFEGMLVNLISDAIMLVATVFILERLIKRHYEKAAKAEERNRYLGALKDRHDSLAAKLEMSYLHFVTKVPAQLFFNDEDRKKDKRLIEVASDLERYITKDFLRKNYEVLIIDPINVTQAHDATMTYQVFLKQQFRDKILQMTTAYASRYMLFIPKDILEAIFKIEDLLNSDVFALPEDHGLKIDISQAKFEPEGMLDKLDRIGIEIIKIKEYT